MGGASHGVSTAVKAVGRATTLGSILPAQSSEILERPPKRLELDGDERQRREEDLQRFRGLLEQKSGAA